MARYKKHVVQYGDTMQSISQLETGSVGNWVDIVEYNKLKYPYIVQTNEERKENLESTVTIGDVIIIPVASDLTEIDPYALTNQDKNLIMSLALGRDLSMTSNQDYYNKRGTSDEILEVVANGKGDLATVDGVENLKQALIARLLTPKGALMLHPEYGSNLHKMFKKATHEQASLIDIEITRTLLLDGRVETVESLGYKVEEDVYVGKFLVTIESLQTAFEFVVQGDTTGSIILLDN
ncbi:baseplate assembly protein [Listeria phage P100plus]|uniref:Baseplate assembly protein n=12 Tax=Pecentumvirus TaxID=1857844 RepID=A0A5C2IG07_9CAUD|nr:baseplate protein [Listeria phage vB_LmoM_AG20]YP_008240082.1 putative baseplate protein [Listeria phage LP-125]YP_009042909.1 baseplate protein [Listeria phage LP-048]YP_009055696.1 baseplate protein [Listeria phage LMTA-148]YP_009592649.1 baseplate protein [Listeria phage LP-064]YP_406409.1 baseplate protein [Listeria phage P100]QEP53099.2 baseplate assembly protein [Listeria phage LP-039]QIG60850.1 putative baseplate wedge 1 protein [Listeria phage vB_Lino_VEfB7]QIG61038.1 putative ba